MLRIRLASLALATGLLFSMSGCCSMNEEGRLFPRLFNHSSMSAPRHQGECECHGAGFPPGVEMSQGPIMPGAVQTMPPITTLPANQTPQAFKNPPANSVPWVPAAH